MNLNAEYWTNRYLDNTHTWDAGDITTPIKEYIDQLTDKTISILIPGAGNGYEAEYLMKQGFSNVYILDYSKIPLDNLKKRLPQLKPEQLICDDFFNHKGQYDLVIEQTFFCALDPKLRKDYVLGMHKVLKPNGKLVGLLFENIKEDRNDGPPFTGDKEEYKELFSPYFKILRLEPCYNSIKPRSGKELWFSFQKAN